MPSYEERMNLPLAGQPDVEFFTKSGLLVARGYQRVVIGQRGPYIEFADSSIIFEALHVPEDQQWRLNSNYDYVFYNEYRSHDESNVKFYHQRRTVEYADYKIGFWYASPFDLTTLECPVLVKPAERKKKSQ